MYKARLILSYIYKACRNTGFLVTEIYVLFSTYISVVRATEPKQCRLGMFTINALLGKEHVMCTSSNLNSNLTLNLVLSKKDFYSIPYWDRLKINKLNPEPEYDTGVEHLRAHTIDKTHYLLSQLVVWGGEYKKYELLLVTIHGLQPDGSYWYKTYRPIRVVWFY